MDQVELSMLVDIGLKFYAVPSRPTGVTLRSMSLVIDFNRFSGKAQVRRATLSCDSSYYNKLYYNMVLDITLMTIGPHLGIFAI